MTDFHTNFHMARQLWAAYGEATPDQPATPSDATRFLVARLILKEALEAVEAITGLPMPDLLEGTLHRFDGYRNYWNKQGERPLPNQDLVATATELADLLVVAYGAGVSHGFPMDEVFPEVCLSNLTKADGERRPDGKVTKEGSSYQPPDVARILEQARHTQPPADPPWLHDFLENPPSGPRPPELQ